MLALLLKPYVLGARLLAEQLTGVIRTYDKTTRRKWVVFTALAAAMSATAAQATYYIVAFINDHARCPAGYYCDPARVLRMQQHTSHIDWAICLTVASLIAAILLKIAQILGAVDDVVWSKLNRLLTRQLPSHRPSFITYQADKYFTRTCWVLIGLSCASSLSLIALKVVFP